MTVDRLKSTWEDLGKADPLWAVLTDPERRHGGWDVDEFLATGVEPIAQVKAMLDEAGLSLGDRVLDFGCGVGRLTNALAAHAREVVGVDIAQSMIDEAHRINRLPDRVGFVAYDGHRLPFDDETFDAAVSLISVQHSPAAVQLACLVELQRVVRPGGVLAIQIPYRPSRPEQLPTEGMRARIELLEVPSPVGVGQVAPVRTRVTNVSQHLWPAGRLIRLGNHWLADDEPVRWNDGRTDLPHDLAPDQSVVLELPVVAPDEPGTYDLELDIVQEAVTWWAEVGSTPVRTPVTVVAGTVVEVPAVSEPQEVRIEPMPAPRGRDDGGMEMFGMDVNLVRLLFTHCGSEIVNIVPDDMAGAEWESFTYVIRRGGST
ncbi:class I SAM-dependent methyltransferase [Actinophytocola oryzae]|uniref:Methyltransferase family protein n=1 Tax=Actinophytocola oryzae TaxID=502181 RepID=A0A4R7VMX7_9PSEU|nr:class I SAM-dependent methyltransferase [Actinophytocola oryzae]TDV50894.1 methyltransferase family protein [Actinophytocola oryzae]